MKIKLKKTLMLLSCLCLFSITSCSDVSARTSIRLDLGASVITNHGVLGFGYSGDVRSHRHYRDHRHYVPRNRYHYKNYRQYPRHRHYVPRHQHYIPNVIIRSNPVIIERNPVIIERNYNDSIVIVNTNLLNVRSGPNYSNEVITVARNGEYLRVIGSYNNWLNVSCNGINGWIVRNYVRFYK